jgi:hypothetical protein
MRGMREGQSSMTHLASSWRARPFWQAFCILVLAQLAAGALVAWAGSLSVFVNTISGWIYAAIIIFILAVTVIYVSPAALSKSCILALAAIILFVLVPWFNVSQVNSLADDILPGINLIFGPQYIDGWFLVSVMIWTGTIAAVLFERLWAGLKASLLFAGHCLIFCLYLYLYDWLTGWSGRTTVAMDYFFSPFVMTSWLPMTTSLLMVRSRNSSSRKAPPWKTFLQMF